jgi:hypothetical protein
LRPSDWPTSRAGRVGADACGELAVADDAARRDRPRRGVDAAVERGEARIVDADRAEVGPLAAQEAVIAATAAATARRARFGRVGKRFAIRDRKPSARRLGQPRGDDAGVVPGERAVADRGGEDGEGDAGRMRRS